MCWLFASAPVRCRYDVVLYAYHNADVPPEAWMLRWENGVAHIIDDDNSIVIDDTLTGQLFESKWSEVDNTVGNSFSRP